MSNAFSPAIGELRPASRVLIGHLKADENRAVNRLVNREQWMIAGLATSLAVAPAAAALMLGLPLSLGAITVGAVALPTLAVGATAVALIATAGAVMSSFSAKRQERVANYLNKHIRHLEQGGLPHTALEEMNKSEQGFFQRLANRRGEKAAQRANPMLKRAIKNGI